VRAWDPLEAFLTTFEDLLAAALPVTFGFVTSSHLSNLTAILEQPDGPQASLLQGVCQPPPFQRCMGGPHNIPSGQSRFSLSCLNRFALMPHIDCTARLLKDEAVPAKHDGRSA
jgi:hypothetical protein